MVWRSGGRSGTTRTDSRIESTSRSSRSIWSTVPRCHDDRCARRTGSRDERPSRAGSSASRSVYARTTASGVRSSWVTSAMSSLRAWSSALSCSTCASASRWSRPFSTIPASRSAIADSWSTSDGVNSRCSSVWTLSTPTTWSCHSSGTDSIEATNRRWSMPAHPQEARIGGHVGDDHRLAHGRDPPGDPLPERHHGAPDLEAVEAVRRRERQPRAVAVEQVQRRDARPERVPRPVDDGLEQLLPRLGGRDQAQELVEEAKLGDRVLGPLAERLARPVRGARRAPSRAARSRSRAPAPGAPGRRRRRCTAPRSRPS